MFSEREENMFLERWIKSELRADALQEEVDILSGRVRELKSGEASAFAVTILRDAIALHQRTIDSPTSPELAGIVDRHLWAVLTLGCAGGPGYEGRR